eukprot:m.68167 g.68167  ORF g.68167 m.68167 type:complete len:100 (+) comp11946_c0_seq1:376-675(+)
MASPTNTLKRNTVPRIDVEGLSSMFVLDTYLLVFGIILQEWKKMCRNIESPQIQILLGLPVIHSLPSIINLSCASYESSGINLVTFANSTCRLANSGHM